MTPQLPGTPAEWQDAVDLAKGLLALHAAGEYGLITGGLAVNVGRCEELLALGAVQGITPADDAVERVVNGLVNA